MQIDAEVLYRPFETLSGGERTKLLLACLFLGENKFLLIDKPTNHLDMLARMTVAEYLQTKKDSFSFRTTAHSLMGALTIFFP